MTQDELVNNLGVIAKSGTSAFLEKMGKPAEDGEAPDDSMNLIGQFGVGFYSVFLVADYVEVSSKSNDSEEQYYWASKADGSFVVGVDTEHEPLGRGTEIRIHLRDDLADEYSDEYRLEQIIKKYSQFISYPIILMKPEQYFDQDDDMADVLDEEEEAEADDEGDDEEDDEADDDSEDEDAEDEDEMPPEPKTKTRFVPTIMNEAKAVWLRSPSMVEEDEYFTLYRALDTNAAPPMASGEDAHIAPYLAKTHFVGEGDVEFRTVLFLPLEPAPSYFEQYHQNAASSIKFYIRRVFITDSFLNGGDSDSDDILAPGTESGSYNGLLPKYLSFAIGVVDSDSLPLNVNREQLQQNKLLAIMKKKLARKVLDLLKKLAADGDESCLTYAPPAIDGDAAADGDDDTPAVCTKSRYQKFWDSFGLSIKYGVLEDYANRKRLMKLLRYKSTHTEGDATVSFDTYVSRMKEGQEYIYFIAGMSVEEMLRSPSLEKLKALGYEVLLMDSTIDEYVMMHATEYTTDVRNANTEAGEDEEPEDKTYSFKNVNTDSLSFGKDNNKLLMKHYKKKFKKFTTWMRDAIRGSDANTTPGTGNGNLNEVKVSNRLETSPAVVVSGKYGYSANMERIINAQVGSGSNRAQQFSERTLELNPRHPVIVRLKELYEEELAAADAEDEEMVTKDSVASMMAMTIYEAALLESGFGVDVVDFNANIFSLLKTSMGVDVNAGLLPEDEVEEEEEEEDSETPDVDEADFDPSTFESMFGDMDMDAFGDMMGASDNDDDEEEEEPANSDFGNVGGLGSEYPGDDFGSVEL